MGALSIVKVQPHQMGALQKIGQQTFRETFSDFNSEANMKIYLEEGFSIGKLTSEY